MPRAHAKKPPAVDKLDFEQSLAALEALVAELEGGELSLEASLAAFERGVALSRRSEQLLGAAEQRVQLLQQDSDAGAEALVEFEAHSESESAAAPEGS